MTIFRPTRERLAKAAVGVIGAVNTGMFLKVTLYVMAMGDLTYVDKQVSRCGYTLWPLGALRRVILVYKGINMI